MKKKSASYEKQDQFLKHLLGRRRGLLSHVTAISSKLEDMISNGDSVMTVQNQCHNLDVSFQRYLLAHEMVTSCDYIEGDHCERLQGKHADAKSNYDDLCSRAKSYVDSVVSQSSAVPAEKPNPASDQSNANVPPSVKSQAIKSSRSKSSRSKLSKSASIAEAKIALAKAEAMKMQQMKLMESKQKLLQQIHMVDSQNIA